MIILRRTLLGSFDDARLGRGRRPEPAGQEGTGPAGESRRRTGRASMMSVATSVAGASRTP